MAKKRKTLYFAYGSNLYAQQMLERCPSARFVDKVELKGYRLEFFKHADIVPCKGSKVEGILYEISIEDEAILDMYEGVPTSYGKWTVPVQSIEHPLKKYRVLTYMKQEKLVIYPKYKYYTRIIEGLRFWNLSVHAVRKALWRANERNAQLCYNNEEAIYESWANAIEGK